MRAAKDNRSSGDCSASYSSPIGIVSRDLPLCMLAPRGCIVRLAQLHLAAPDGF